MRYRALIFSALLVLMALSPCYGGELKIYGTYRWMHAISDTSVGPATIEAADEWAWGGGADFSFASWGSVGIDYMRAELNLTAVGHSLGTADADIYGGALNFHVLSDEKIDLYLGFGPYYAELSKFTTPFGSSAAIEDELTVGLSGGLDLAVTKRVWATFGARYLDLEVRNMLNSVEVDPLTLSAGLAVRFGE